jgi:small subunit ribosomal protein S20
MPITASAKKTNKSSQNKRVFNMRRVRSMRAAVKNTIKLSHDGKQKEAGKLLPQAYKAIDKAVKRGVIKKNTAARKKSRLAKLARK